MASIKFDNTEILNTTYVPRFVKHESVANRDVVTMPLAREDGEIIIVERYGTKRILLQGIITGISEANLEANIETFKEFFSRPEKNLDVSWNSGTLRYVATCTKHEFDRDHFHLLFAPWTAEFLVASGEGKATSTTKALDENVLVVTTPASDAFTLSGTKPPKPKITLKGSSWPASIKGIEYKNVDTGEKMVITVNKVWTTGSVIIDCLLRKVTENVVAGIVYTTIAFYGVFPRFKIGANNILVTAGGIVNQETGENGDLTYVSIGYNLSNVNTKLAQSFRVPYANDTFQGITVVLEKTSSPGNITWRIETDNGDQPSGNLAHANATGTILPGDVGGSKAYISKYSGSLWPLAANTKYWLVLSAAGVDGSNFYTWSVMPDEPALYPRYTKGQLKTSFDGGATWANGLGINYDFLFKILYGGYPSTGGAKHTVEYTKTYL